MGGISAAIRGDNILAGLGTGAIVGFSAGLGVGLGVGLMGVGSGFVYTAQLSLVSGFISGLISGTIFQMISNDPKAYLEGFGAGFTAGVIGGVSFGLGMGAGITEEAEILLDSPNTNQLPQIDSIDPDLIKKVRTLQ